MESRSANGREASYEFSSMRQLLRVGLAKNCLIQNRVLIVHSPSQGLSTLTVLASPRTTVSCRYPLGEVVCLVDILDPGPNLASTPVHRLDL
jgi:hypothetical protein